MLYYRYYRCVYIYIYIYIIGLSARLPARASVAEP